ncbi:hypothetical protein, partial [uncultured Parabacteroides sp.]|uniref:hypothetical protein n=1 Tax=uncultured Parabacteroides sp. TaxID=512312 RepID=UPI00261339E9
SSSLSLLFGSFIGQQYFKIDASKREDDVKLRLRILELKVEYDKAMTCNYLNLEACYRFVKYGINEDYQSIQL